ncbi:MAG TPA: hypothetical protein VFZ08_01050 [Terriglobia bacterium]|nr:hypothetical protein [Terriglobia bacterium]
MKRLSLLLSATLVFSGVMACGQQSAPPQNQQQQEQRPTLGREPAQKRPTLGQAPSLRGPLTATIMDARKLRAVRTVYVGMIDNKLSLKLINNLGKEGPFRVAENRNAADAVLQGTCFDSLHLKDVHSEVFLTGKDGKAIWQDVIHEPYHPPALSVAVNKTADKIVNDLRQSIEAAEHR